MTKQNENKKEKYATKKGIVKNTREKNTNVKEKKMNVEKRVRNFCEYLLENYNGKTIALVSHKAPQLALEVITKNISWEQAIKQDWRKTKNWQPGWEYIIK